MQPSLNRNKWWLSGQESLCAPKATFFEKSTAHSRRFQNSPFGLRQLKSYAHLPL